MESGVECDEDSHQAEADAVTSSHTAKRLCLGHPSSIQEKALKASAFQYVGTLIDQGPYTPRRMF